MMAYLLILDKQSEKFERIAAEYDLTIRKEGRNPDNTGNYYECLFTTPATLFYVGSACGFSEGLNYASGSLDKLLQN